MQSKAASLIETSINITAGFVISMIISHFVLPYFLGVTPTFSENFQITLVFTVVSFIKGYFIRRAFNRWHIRKHGPIQVK